MNRLAFALFGVAAFGLLGCAGPVYSHGDGPSPMTATPVSASLDIDYFYDALAPYGIWVDIDPYGLCWMPEDVPADWQPYTDGDWVYTDDYGWTWVSDEEWGWAPFHYGRWAWVDGYDWVWVPGYEWAPAWVAWRVGDGYVGWAPLPPEARWEVGVGFVGGGFSWDAGIDRRGWCFVREDDIVRPHVGRYAASEDRIDLYMHNSQNVTRYATVNNRIVDNGVNTREVEQTIGHPLPHFRIENRATGSGHPRLNVRGNVLQIPRPPAGPARQVASRRPYLLSQEVVQRQVSERRQLSVRHLQERQQLEARYRQEIASANAQRRAAVQKQLEGERNALAARQAHERQDLVKRHAQERAQQERRGRSS